MYHKWQLTPHTMGLIRSVLSAFMGAIFFHDTSARLCLLCMHSPLHLAQRAALTQRGHSQSPSSAAQLRRCCCRSLAWRPGHWCQGAAHCLECSVLCGHPSGYEAGVPVWTQHSVKMEEGSCHPCKCNAKPCPLHQPQEVWYYRSAPNTGVELFTLPFPTQEAYRSPSNHRFYQGGVSDPSACRYRLDPE